MSRAPTIHEGLTEVLARLRDLGTRVKHRREAARLTRRRLADETQLPVSTIHRLESGRTADEQTWLKVLAHPAICDRPEPA
jgi:transcriptional regulator with XRE-family HTH domain